MWKEIENISWYDFCENLDNGVLGKEHYFFFEHIHKEAGKRIEKELNDIAQKIEVYHFDPRALYLSLGEYLQDTDRAGSTFWETYYFLKKHGIDPKTAKLSEVFSFFVYNFNNARILEEIK